MVEAKPGEEFYISDPSCVKLHSLFNPQGFGLAGLLEARNKNLDVCYRDAVLLGLSGL